MALPTISAFKNVMKGAQEKFGISEVKLTIRSFNGSLFLVDQNGKLIQGIKSVRVCSDIHSITEIDITALSFRHEEGFEDV